MKGAKLNAKNVQSLIDADPLLRDKQRMLVPPIALNAAEFLKTPLPKRESLLGPWLPQQGLAMAYAPRGVGKTFFAMNCAYAVASGGEFLGWKAPQQTRVLYIDGEMPAAVMQRRLADIIAAHTADAADDALMIMTPDLQHGEPMPNLASPIDQARIDPLIDGVGLVIVDNISTLCRGGVENEGESWEPVQSWALRLRARGISVLFVHHAGKGGAQRGTSRREDVLDTVVALKQPSDYSPEDGARFEIHFEKSRGFHGSDAEPREAQLVTNFQGELRWSWRTLEASTFERVVELAKERLSQADIARELDLNRSTVSRHIKNAKSQGALQ